MIWLGKSNIRSKNICSSPSTLNTENILRVPCGDYTVSNVIMVDNKNDQYDKMTYHNEANNMVFKIDE